MRPTTLRADAQTDIVVDVGCLSYEDEDSIFWLIRRFHPKILYGFDIHPALQEKVAMVEGTVVVTSRRGAWTRDGKMPYEINGNCTHVSRNGASQETHCFDLATLLRSFPAVPLVLKIDAEGAEYELLPHLIAQRALQNVTRVIVEWHMGALANGWESDREAIVAQIPCPVEEWH